MRGLRTAGLIVLSGLLSAGTGLGSLPAASAAAVAHFQGEPVTLWTIPGDAPLDGAGGWVYVAPEPAPGVDQLPSDRYEYDLTFQFANLDLARIGLTRTAAGPIAGFMASQNAAIPVVTAPYAWAPGHIYFLLLYKFGPGLLGGWAYDFSAGAWTFLGQAQVPTDQGLLMPNVETIVEGAQGIVTTRGPFTNAGAESIPSCSQFPRVEAYFYPPMGWRGSTITSATSSQTANMLGDCPTSTTVQNGWTHYTLGALPTP
jgi:hypothetical protein